MRASYHVFVLSVGKEGVERVHLEYQGDTQQEAEKRLKRSQRHRVIGYRLAHPTSHYRPDIEAREARVFDPLVDDVHATRRRRRRRR